MHGTEKEIISKNFQFGTKDSHVRFIIYYLVRIVHFMGRILVLEKVFEMIFVIYNYDWPSTHLAILQRKGNGK